ncbi:hypothetical protein Tco_0610442 [Tanacetum coccineum]
MSRGALSKDHLCQRPTSFAFGKPALRLTSSPKDIDLWQVIQNGEFAFEMEDLETKMTPYELLKDYEKKSLGRKMKPRCNSQVKDSKISLLTQQYVKFSISSEETINSGFIKFNAIVTSLKSLDQDYPNKNYMRKFLLALPLKWRAKTIKEKVKSLALKARVTREQTSNDSDSQGGSDEYEDEEFNLMARNF